MPLLERLSWKQAQEAIKDNLVIVPTGSIEQHGPHMPVGTDYFIADKFGKMLADKSDFVVTPTLVVGYADYHDDFAGTLSVNPNVLVEYLKGIVNKVLRHGASHIMFVNTHGGNMGSIKSVIYDLRKAGVPACAVNWWDVATVQVPEKSAAGHGDWIETSMVLAYDPSVVHMDIAKQPTVREIDIEGLELGSPGFMTYKGVKIQTSLKTRDYTLTGNMAEAHLTPNADVSIPPSAATAEIGDELFGAVVDFLVDFGHTFKEFSLEQFED